MKIGSTHFPHSCSNGTALTGRRYCGTMAVRLTLGSTQCRSLECTREWQWWQLIFFEMVASVALIMINCKHAVHGATFCLRSDRQTHRNGHAHIPVTLANRETAFGCYPAAAPKKVCIVLQQTVWPSYASGSWNFSSHFLTTTLSRGPFFCTHLREWEYGSGGGDSRKPKTRSRRQERKMRKDMEKQRNK